VRPAGLLRAFRSARTTVVLLCLLGVLLLLNVALPQRAVVGDERFAAAARDGWSRFVLVDLGFGNMPTSPVFLTVLGLFFLNLAVVLLSRAGPTWRRIAMPERSEGGLSAWARLEESLTARAPDGWSAGRGARTLREFGYQVRRPGPATLFGVKHRTAPLGFLLFHLSFFLICAGGISIYYTRFVGTIVLSEGQEFTGSYTGIQRRPPLGGAPNLRFTLDEVDPRFERGEPVHLGATLRLLQAGSTRTLESRVNHPARWGSARLLVETAGLAPVLWLQDERGFTLDRVVAPVRARGGASTVIAMAEDRFTVRLEAGVPDGTFPSREELADTPMELALLEQDRPLFEGALRPGQAAAVPGARLVMEELRYWAGVRVIAERGGGVLVAGFVAGIAGLIWRLLLYRREIAVAWDDQELRMVGRSEYFTGRFQEELRAVRDSLAGSPGVEASGASVEVRRAGEET
jgi:hypothetical protein